MYRPRVFPVMPDAPVILIPNLHQKISPPELMRKIINNYTEFDNHQGYMIHHDKNCLTGDA